MAWSISWVSDNNWKLLPLTVSLPTVCVPEAVHPAGAGGVTRPVHVRETLPDRGLGDPLVVGPQGADPPLAPRPIRRSPIRK